jgi:hypothetical protein
MFSGTIKCMNCGSDNVIEIQGIVTVCTESDIAMYFRFKPSTGYLYYRCVVCSAELAIDPAETLVSKMIRGMPEFPPNADALKCGRT